MSYKETREPSPCLSEGYYTLTPLHTPDKLVEVSAAPGNTGNPYLFIGTSEVTDRKLFRIEYNAEKKAMEILPKPYNNRVVVCVSGGSKELNVPIDLSYRFGNMSEYFSAMEITDSITSSATYQDNGNFLHTTTDSRGKVTTYTYDTNRGVQTDVTDANNVIVHYELDDDNDRLDSVSVGNVSASYTYDDAGHLKTITSPSNTVYNIDYNGFFGKSAIRVGNRILAQYAYSRYNARLEGITYANGHQTVQSFDRFGRLTIKWFNNTIFGTYSYDKFGRLYSKNDLFTNTLTRYMYDLSGRTTGIHADNGVSVDYAYDSFNRVNKMVSKLPNSSLLAEYLYGTLENGQMTGVLYGVKQNGQNSLSYAYDRLARMTSRTLSTATPFVTRYTFLEGATAGTTTTLIKTVKNGEDTLEYAYDNVGNIDYIKKNGVVAEDYGYDNLNQLTSATYGGHTYTYVYDNGGNLQTVQKDGQTVKSYTYGDTEWKDLLTAFNGQTITYDQIGNPLQYRDGFNFTWNYGRRLTGITRGTDSISYNYDVDGLRTQKTVNGTVTDYYWINGVLQGQKTGDEYLIFLYDENGTAYGMIVKNGTTEETYYFVFNAQGDVIGIVDNNGTLVVEYTYGAWGDVVSITGTAAQTIGQKNPIRYRGYYYDDETGFYYLQSRYYDPEMQRFINADGQISGVGGEVLGYNMFAYCMNNPVNMSDETGNWPKWIKKAADKVKKTVKKVINTVKNEIKKIVSNKKKSTEKLSYKSNGTKNGAQISNSYTVNDPFVMTNYVNDNRGDDIAGSTSGVVTEWIVHNVAYKMGEIIHTMGFEDIGSSLMERGATLDIGSTIYDDSHGISSIIMWTTYATLSPLMASYDLVIEFFE